MLPLKLLNKDILSASYAVTYLVIRFLVLLLGDNFEIKLGSKPWLMDNNGNQQKMTSYLSPEVLSFSISYGNDLAEVVYIGSAKSEESDSNA